MGDEVQQLAVQAVAGIRQVLRDGSHYTDAALIDLIRRILTRHDAWSPADDDAFAERRRAFMVEEHPDLLAFDGSNVPQKRRLTARDRDVLVRVVNTAYFAAVRAAQEPPDTSGLGPLAGLCRDNPDQLAELIFVLNPRL